MLRNEGVGIILNLIMAAAWRNSGELLVLELSVSVFSFMDVILKMLRSRVIIYLTL